MADEDTTPDQTQQPNSETAEATEASPEDATADQSGEQQKSPDAEQLGDRGKKALDSMKQQRNQARNELEQTRAKLKELEDRDKTEVQRAQEAHTEATRRASEAEAKLTRFQVAAEKGLDAELVDFLPTGSREDMEAAADTLLGKLAAAREPRRPKPDPSQGTGGQPSDSSMNTLIRSGLGR